MKNISHKIICLFGIGLLSGCSVFAPLNILTPSSGYEVKKDIAYGDQERQKLDVYIPENKKTDKVVVFIYGGKWEWGKKDEYKFAGQAFASEGFIAVIPDYRLHPDVRYPEFLKDNAQAVKWVNSHIKEYGGNPEKIYLVGHSAGAYNAMMLAVNDEYLKAANADPAIIKGVAGIAGPYDFLPLKEDYLKSIFSPAKDIKDTQPINHAKGKKPPMLLMTGDKDDAVLPKNTNNMTAELKKNGNEVKKIIYPGLDHADVIMAISSTFRKKGPLLKEIVDFINAH